jgi:DNA (cytosine-5)-methyltransferase 1
MKMSEHSQQTFWNETELPLMSSLEGSRAKTSALLESSAEWAKGRGQVSGLKSSVWLASYDHNSSSWRTSQHCLLAQANGEADGLAEFSETWPNAGMMQNGKTYQLRPWALLTLENGRGLLHTPRKNDSQKRGNFNAEELRNGFPAAVKRLFLPTIGKSEPKGASRKRYLGSDHFRGAKMSEGLRTCEDDPTYLHPSFAEAVMGFPIGWTELGPVETP